MEKNDDMSGSEESYDSLEGKPDYYVDLIKQARPKFEEEEGNELYSKGLILIGKKKIPKKIISLKKHKKKLTQKFKGHKLKDTLMKSEFKKMFDFVLPARRKAKSKNDKETYAKLVKRQLELLQEFYQISDEAIDDAYGDIELFEESMEHYAANDPEFPKILEQFMEEEAMTYYADEAKANGKEKEVDLELVIQLNEAFIQCFGEIGDEFKGVGDESMEIDLKFNWALDSVWEKLGFDLGVEKLVKDRFKDEKYKKLREVVSKIYNEGAA